MNRIVGRLYEQAVTYIGEQDARQILLLGRTETALEVDAALRSLGVPDLQVEIADPDLDEVHGTPDVVVVCADAEKEEILRAFVDAHGDRAGEPPHLVIAGMGHLAYRDPQYAALDAPAMVPSYATGYPNTRIHIFQCLAAAAANGLEGAVVEFGAFKGGTTAWLGRVVSELGLTNSPVIGFDSWDGFPQRRSMLDMYEHERCVFRGLDEVRRYVEPYNVRLVPGDICDTYRTLEGMPLLLCFFDTDNYSPARAALELCADQLVQGGAIVFDHYTTTEEYLYTLGERIAANEVLSNTGLLHLHETGVFVKI